MARREAHNPVHALDQLQEMRSGGQVPLLDRYLDRLLEEQSPDLQPVLRAIRDRGRVAHRDIARWLSDHGMTIGDSAVYAYRVDNKLARWLNTRAVEVEDA